MILSSIIYTMDNVKNVHKNIEEYFGDTHRIFRIGKSIYIWYKFYYSINVIQYDEFIGISSFNHIGIISNILKPNIDLMMKDQTNRLRDLFNSKDIKYRIIHPSN